MDSSAGKILFSSSQTLSTLREMCPPSINVSNGHESDGQVDDYVNVKVIQ